MSAQVVFREKVLSIPHITRMYGVTEEQFDELTDEDSSCELIDGVMIMHSPATCDHEETVGLIHFLVAGFVHANGLGRVFGSHAVLRLAAGRCLEPDLTFCSHARNPLIGKVIEGTADLVVEVLSPSTRDYDLREKRQLYRQARTPELWFIDPDGRSVVQDLRVGRTYKGRLLRRGRLVSRVLPGFWLQLDWLWQRPLVNPLECLNRILQGKPGLAPESRGP